MNQELHRLKEQPLAVIGIAVALLVLIASYVFQSVDLLFLFDHGALHSYIHFVARKLIRVIINDSCLLLMIHLWFNDKKITQLAWKVQLVDTLILFPAYLIVKLMIEGDSEISSPLLSQLHRMIVNPTLMILIIPGVYFQRLKKENGEA